MRFHFGVSFRLKYLKKFLFPILIGILAYFGFGLISYIPTFAVQNYNTQYNITIPNYDEYYNNITCGNETVKDFLHNFVENYNNTNSLYNIIIVPELQTSQGNFNENFLTFYTYKKSKTSYNRFSYYGTSSKFYMGYMYKDDSSAQSDFSYYVKLSSCDSAISSSSSFQTYLNYIYGTYSPSYVVNQKINEDNQGYLLAYGTPTATSFLASYNDNQTFNNNDSFTLNNVKWYYWSNRTLNYKSIYNNYYTSSSNYWKKLYITNNDTTYSYLDDLVSFYDIKDTFPDVPSGPTRLGYRDSIDTIYTNFNSSDISNFNLTYSFKVPLIVNSQDYVNNLKFDYYCTSRNIYKDPQDTSNSFLYYYIDEPCSLSYTSTINNDNITYTFNNLLFTNTLTDKKVYLTIKSNYLDNTLSKSIYNVSYTNRVGNFFNTIYRGLIYENFDNLPLSFKLLLSNNGNSINSYVSLVKPNSIYNINYSSYTTNSDINIREQNNLTIVGNSILSCATNNCTNDIGLTDNDFLTLNVSSVNNSSLMIYQNNSNVILPKLNLFFNRGVGISFGDASDFYYIDTDGDYSNGSFTEPIPYNNANFVSDNTGSYNNTIISFINSLNDKIIYFQSIVQDVYDGFPPYLQTTLFVLFILFCTYFLYLLIKR